MADILIRGMEMPKYTTKADFGIDADGNPLCMLYHEDRTEPDIYDVVPLPEGHGRLIDADELDEYYCFDEQEKYDNYVVPIGVIRQNIKDAHTIVPAEGGAEDG